MNNLAGNILYLAAVLLAFTWAVGFYGYQAGGVFHLLLLTAAALAYVSIWEIEKHKLKSKRHDHQHLS